MCLGRETLGSGRGSRGGCRVRTLLLLARTQRESPTESRCGWTRAASRQDRVVAALLPRSSVVLPRYYTVRPLGSDTRNSLPDAISYQGTAPLENVSHQSSVRTHPAPNSHETIVKIKVILYIVTKTLICAGSVQISRILTTLKRPPGMSFES